MRNSFLPVMLMLVVMGFTLYLLPRGSGRGTGGPEINAGIFRFPKKAIHQVDSMPLEQENRVVGSAGASAAATADLRQVSVVSGGDHAESTRAVMYALAEEITRLGGIAILDPMRAPESDTSLVLPIGAAQVFRVSTEAEKLPKIPGGEAAATVRVHAQSVRVPDDHPAARLQPAIPVLDRDLVIAHRSHGVQGSWPEWYAAFGRGIAQAVLDAVSPGAAARPSANDRHAVVWGTALPLPPQAKTLRWTAAFQQDLVRGWIGRIDGKRATGKRGAEEGSSDQLVRRMTNAGWTASADVGAGEADRSFRQFTRDRDNMSLVMSLREDDSGFDAVVWQERPHAAELFMQWLRAASSGEEPAIEHAVRDLAPRDDQGRGPPAPSPEAVRAHALDCLRSHLGCAVIPEEYREQARALLATPASAAAAP